MQPNLSMKNCIKCTSKGFIALKEVKLHLKVVKPNTMLPNLLLLTWVLDEAYTDEGEYQFKREVSSNGSSTQNRNSQMCFCSVLHLGMFFRLIGSNRCHKNSTSVMLQELRCI